jgi:hypothetical protein
VDGDDSFCGRENVAETSRGRGDSKGESSGADPGRKRRSGVETAR